VPLGPNSRPGLFENGAARTKVWSRDYNGSTEIFSCARGDVQGMQAMKRSKGELVETTCAHGFLRLGLDVDSVRRRFNDRRLM